MDPADLQAFADRRGIDSETLEDAIAALVVTLLEEYTQNNTVPLLCVIDEAFHIDPQSWKVLLRVAAELQTVLMVLAVRPLLHMRSVIDESVVVSFEALIAIGEEKVQTLKVGALPKDQMIEIARQELGAHGEDELDKELTKFILTKCQGNPLFCKELSRELLNEELVTLDARTGNVRLSESFDSESLTRALPPTVEALLSERLDRLTILQQMVLKTGALIGPKFKLELLRQAYPISAHIGSTSPAYPFGENYDNFMQEVADLDSKHGLIECDHTRVGVGGGGGDDEGESKGGDGGGSAGRSASVAAGPGVVGERNKLEQRYYTFSHGFMCDVLCRRMLRQHRDRISKQINIRRDELEMKGRKAYMEKFGAMTGMMAGGSTALKEDFLFVRKEKAKSMSKIFGGGQWKKRYVTLQDGKLIQRYDATHKMDLVTIDMDSAKVKILEDHELPSQYRGKGNGGFSITAKSWKKKSNTNTSTRVYVEESLKC